MRVASQVELRRYEVSDLDAVLKMCAAEEWASYVEDRNRASKVFLAPGVVAVVASVAGEVVGFAYGQTDGAIQAHLSLLVVNREHRRTGIALALINYMFTLLGAMRMDLITDSAEAFYRTLSNKEESGFRLYAE